MPPFLCLPYVLLLTIFGTAAKKQDHERPEPAEVEPVTGPKVYSTFEYPLTDGLYVGQVACLHARYDT